MNEHDIREKLVLWTAFHSRISDLRLAAFAQKLCTEFDVSTGAITLTQLDCAERFGISPMSVWRYTQALMDCDEWEVISRKAHATTYKPLFVDVALNDHAALV